MNLEENTANSLPLKLVKQRSNEFIIDRNSELSLVAVGCDGTVVNTGKGIRGY